MVISAPSQNLRRPDWREAREQIFVYLFSGLRQMLGSRRFAPYVGADVLRGVSDRAPTS